VIDTFPARNDDEAMIRLNDYREHGAGQSNPDNFGVRRGPGVRGSAASATWTQGSGRPNNPTGRYAIVARGDQAAYGRTGGPPPDYQFRFDMANLEQQGHGRYVKQAWAARNSVDPADYIVVDTTQYADADQIPTIDIDLEPAPPPAGGEFTGNWLIRAEDGTVLHRFGGIGNSQADANRTAQTWAQRNPDVMRQHPGGVDVVPEMMEGVAENFADGKNPGRKGLAKRVGVNTKASVSDLRKTAKNSSGEKQRMAHWLANMKAGRAKAKRK
jgi:hypothetical protein